MRLKQIAPEQWTEAQREIAARIAAPPRGAVRGPYLALIHSPGLCEKFEAMGRFVRFECSVPERLRELAILIVACRWKAEYEWFAHAQLAERAGLAPASIEAIRNGQQPVFADADERVVHDFAYELVHTGRVTDATYSAARDRFGETTVVDLVGLLGNYTAIALVLNAFEVEIPTGHPRPFG